MKRGLWTVALGLLLSAAGLLIAWPTYGQILNSPTASVPGTFERDLEPGTYLVSILTTWNESSGPLTVTNRQRVEVRSLEITGPDGANVAVRNGGNETVTRGSEGFSGLARFDAVVAGTYTIDLQTAEPVDVLVSPSITGFGGRTWAGIALGVVGTLLVLGGAIVAVIGFFKRREPDLKTPAPPYVVAMPPAPPVPQPQHQL